MSTFHCYPENNNRDLEVTLATARSPNASLPLRVSRVWDSGLLFHPHCTVVSAEYPWLLSLTHSLCQWDNISWVLSTPNLGTNMMNMLSSSSFLSTGMDIKSDCTKKKKCSEKIRLCDYSGRSGKTSRRGHIWVVMMTKWEFSLWKKWGKRTQLARASWEEAGDIGLPGSSGFVIRDSRR